MKLSAGRMADKLARRKRRIEKRLPAARDGRFGRMMSGAPPVLGTAGLKYELADKTQAIVSGGVPLMLRVARESGLIDAIDRGLGGPALGALEVEACHCFSEDTAAVARPPVVARSRTSRATPPIGRSTSVGTSSVHLGKSQRRIVPSSLADAIVRPSGLMTTFQIPNP